MLLSQINYLPSVIITYLKSTLPTVLVSEIVLHGGASVIDKGPRLCPSALKIPPWCTEVGFSRVVMLPQLSFPVFVSLPFFFLENI